MCVRVCVCAGEGFGVCGCVCVCVCADNSDEETAALERTLEELTRQTEELSEQYVCVCVRI